MNVSVSSSQIESQRTQSGEEGHSETLDFCISRLKAEDGCFGIVVFVIVDGK